jgi:hypothetical protein
MWLSVTFSDVTAFFCQVRLRAAPSKAMLSQSRYFARLHCRLSSICKRYQMTKINRFREIVASVRVTIVVAVTWASSRVPFLL